MSKSGYIKRPYEVEMESNAIITTWICDCGAAATVVLSELAEMGGPICPDCDGDMNLNGAVYRGNLRELRDKLPPDDDMAKQLAKANNALKDAYIRLDWPDNQEYMDNDGVYTGIAEDGDESSLFVPYKDIDGI